MRKQKLLEQREAYATGGRFSSVILTKEELRQIIAEFATCLEQLDSFPAKCDIVERAKDGTFSLHIIIHFLPPKRSASNSHSAQTENEKPLT